MNKTVEMFPLEQTPIQRFVSEKELMEALRLSRTTLWRLRTRGLPIINIGRSVRYDLEEVRKWLSYTNEGHEDHEIKGREEMSLPDCHWSLSVALDPKHRPQSPTKPASTVRREFWRYPQEAHLLDKHGGRYRRLIASEIAVLQGFPGDWGKKAIKDELLLIRGYGDAVPPPLSEHIFKALDSLIPIYKLQNAVEICAGFGGLALGKTRALDIEHLALVERWPVACEVLRTCGEFPADRVFEEDLKDFDWSQFQDKVDLLSGGPPCQPWSLAGRGLGEDDERDLLGTMPDAVGIMRPKVFVFENVVGLISGDNEDYVKTLIERFRNCAGENSYGVAIGVLNAADFGVPQTRRRVFIVGAAGASTQDIHRYFDTVYRRRTNAEPKLAAVLGLPAWKTVGDAIPDWHELKSQWRKWPQFNENDNNMNAPIKQKNFNLDSKTLKRRNVRVGLDWPSRGLKSYLSSEGGWAVCEERDDLQAGALSPLLPKSTSADPNTDPWYVTGDPMVSLEALRRSIAKQVKLVYIDIPRIKTNAGTFDAAEREALLDTWLTVVQGLLRRCFALLADDGVLVSLCGIEETHYVRMLMDDIAGPANYIGTIAWQKGYSPRNKANMKEVSPAHDNIILFARRMASLPPVRLKVPLAGFVNRDDDPRGPWNADQKGANKPDCDYEVNVCPYRWSITSGSLPPGIWRLNEKSGVIWAEKGALTASGNWPFTARATDKSGNYVERDFVLSVSEDAAAPSLAQIPWLASTAEINKEGELRIETDRLPAARLGEMYSACLIAAGGKPWTGTTRPGKNSAGGKGRYWEFPVSTLLERAATDSVDFKTKDDAIPALKSYIGNATYKPLNQASLWLGSSKNSSKKPSKKQATLEGAEEDAEDDAQEEGSGVGFSQNAKKELDSLLKANVISETVGFSKPAPLMLRLLALFSSADALVVDVGSPAAEMAALSTAISRKAVYVEVNTPVPRREGLLKPRLKYAAQGKHSVPPVFTFYSESDGKNVDLDKYFIDGALRTVNENAGLYQLDCGEPFAEVERVTGTSSINYQAYPETDSRFLDALASLEGLVAIHAGGSEIFGMSLQGKLLAAHLSATKKIDQQWVESLLEKFKDHFAQGGKMKIYYHCGDVPSAYANSLSVQFRRIPFELNLSAGLN